MKPAPFFWRFITLFAALPFIYLVITGHPHNWLYNLSLGLILVAYVAQLVYQWRAGHKALVKGRLILLGVLITVLLLMALFR